MSSPAEREPGTIIARSSLAAPQPASAMVLALLGENGILIELSFLSFPVRPPIIMEGTLQRWGKGGPLECILRSDPAGVPAKVCATGVQGGPA